MDLPDYVSIPLVLVIFIAMMVLFGALLYCCRWLGVPKDLPVRDSGEEQIDGEEPGPSGLTKSLLNKKKKKKTVGEKWDTHFVLYHKQAWLRWYRKGYVSISKKTTNPNV